MVDERLSKNFMRSEFACTGHGCCGKSAAVTTELVHALQQLRDLVNAPLVIISGFRCRAKNDRTPGAAKDSYHTKGMAADIVCPSVSPSQLALYAEQVPAFRQGGIAVYGAWVHVDVRTNGKWRG